MKGRAQRAVSQQTVEPSPERRRHGRIERVSHQIADQRGDPARPFRAVDTLGAMERHGTITASMRQAADDFRRDFQIADLRALLCDAAEEGARKVLDHLGLGDDNASEDVRLMRDIARGVREAKREVWRTIGKGLVWLVAGGVVFWATQKMGALK